MSGACLRFEPFGCQDATQCDAQPLGRCEAVGYCSYPDLTCIETAHRFADDAGDGLGGQCVAPSVAGTGTEGATDTATATESETSLDGGTQTTGPDPSESSDDDPTTGSDCGGGGQACCAGDSCEAGLQCADGLCGCVASVAVGDRHTCAVKLDGTVWCWGANDLGQLAVAEPAMSSVPVQIPGIGMGSPATGLFARTHTCAALNDGSLLCWGDNAGQKANVVDPSPTILTPAEASWAVPAATVGVGGTHTCVGRGMGQAPTCWGANGAGQLTTAVAPGPAIVPGGFEPSIIALGQAHSCMNTLTGELYCWGDNAFGQLATDPLVTPSLDVPQVVPIRAVTALATGSEHTCIITGADVQCWGRNTMGQLGNDTTTSGFTPTSVLFPPGSGNVAAVVAAADQTCARMASGALYCWGGNQTGELLLQPDENGEDGFALTPRLIELDFDVAQIATGATHSCALSSAGQVLCWGSNDQGQIGDGTGIDAQEPTPAQISCP